MSLKFHVIDYPQNKMCVLVEEKENRVILYGEYDPTTMSEVIDGFFIGLDYAGVDYEFVEYTNDGDMKTDFEWVKIGESNDES